MSGAANLGAAVHHHDHRLGFVERHLRLAKDFRRDKFVVFGDNAAGIDHAQMAALPVGLAVEPVARDAGFVADDGAPLADQSG